MGAMARALPEYVSYLLRLWRASEVGEPPGVLRKTIWRASVESSRTGERRGFAALDELFAFLREQTGERGGDDDDGQPGYLSYLLRLWREQGEGGEAWQASLECTSSGELELFKNLDELFDYLRERTGAAQDSMDVAGGDPRR